MKYKLLFFLLLVFSARIYGQCTVTVNLTASTTSVCNGTAAVLTATPSGGTGPYTYVWKPTGETTQSISPEQAGVYTVIVYDKGGCTASKDITLAANPTPSPPAAADAITCPNTPANLLASGSTGSYQWYDAAVAGNFLSGNASYQTGPITAKTTYYVETTVNGCTSSRTPVNVFPISGPTVTTGSTCPGSSVTLMASGAGEYKWYDNPSGTGIPLSSSATYTTPSLFTTTNYYVVGITAGCVSLPTLATATVTSAPAPPNAPGVSTCSGSGAVLHASGPDNAVFDWFDVPTGGTSLISSPDFTTPALTSSKTYYVQASVGDCVGSRTAVTVTINPIPADPVLTDVSGCFGTAQKIDLPVLTGATYNWYATANSFTKFYTGNSYTIANLTAPTTYYIEVINSGGCASARKPINVLLNPAPAAPTVPNATICANNVATLTATGPAGATYNWYNTATGGTQLPNPNADPASFTTPVLNATTIYYVQATVNGCNSARTGVTVNINAPPAAPTAIGPPPVCAGSPVTLTAIGTGISIEWYDAPTGGTKLGGDNTLSIFALTNTTTYYVQTTDANGCSSPRKAITATVNSLPPQLTVTGNTSICAGSKASLKATSAGATTIYWYDDATNPTPIFSGGSGSTYNTIALSKTRTYYVSASNGTCESLREPVTVTVYSGDQFIYPSGTYCISGGVNPIAVIKTPGGTFSGSGGVVVNPTNGAINLATTPLGKYTITYTNGCAITTRTISIVNSPDAAFSYIPAVYCEGIGAPTPTYTNPTGTAGIFTSSPAGLVFVDASAGVIDMSASKPNTYTVYNTIDGVVGCTNMVGQATVTIAPAASVNAGPDQTVGTGTPVQLAGGVYGGATTGTWSGGTGSFSNKNAGDAIYTPGPGETSATLTLTSAAPAAPCTIGADAVVIKFNPQPAPPVVKTVPATLPVCAGTPVTLTATAAPGASFKWYDAATGGNLLSKYANYPILPTATTNYYVEATVAGVTSTRTLFQITVNPLPDPPTVDPIPAICPGTKATITAHGSTGGYSWYTVPTGGIAFASNITTPLVTGVLTTNTTYYVEAVNSTGCASATRTKVDVNINPVPNVISSLIDNVCSGTALNYPITADQTGATFTYSRNQPANINNPAVNNVSASTITDVLISTATVPVNVTYTITPHLNNCDGPPVNYVVTVYPTPLVTNDTTNTHPIVCNGVAPAPNSPVFTITFNTPGAGTVATWSRDAVAGVSNRPVTGQVSNSIRETLFNNTQAPVDVFYNFTYNNGNCQGSTYRLRVTVNPTAVISSSPSGTACSGIPQAYNIVSNVPSAKFSWSRQPRPEINNNVGANVLSNTIDETLVNNTTKPVTIAYAIVASENACTANNKYFTYTVTVGPQIPTPIATAPKSICSGKSITLNSPTIVVGAIYHWTGPNGFKSDTQNPNVNVDNATTANAGTYTLYLTLNDCASKPATVDVGVIDVPKVNAGSDVTVCPTTNSVPLEGSVKGGSNKGIWSINGVTDGRLPDPTNAKGNYIPTAADVAAGSVTLTFTYIGPDVCDIIYDEVVIKFGLIPGTNAGPDQEVCSQATTVPLAGKMILAGDGTWSTSGTGKFSSDPALQPHDGPSPEYRPSAADIAAGSIKLFLAANNPDPACYITTDTVTLTFRQPPKVSAGDTKYVLKGNTVVLTPTVSDPNVTYNWQPSAYLNDNTLKNPTVTGDIDRVFTLTVTDSLGCVASSSVTVKVAPPIIIPNTFTPNGDGINDLWDIQGLIAYTAADVSIFTRSGQKIYHSIGYSKPWDGMYDGKPLPFGTYYYVIDPKFFFKTFSGYVTLVK